MLAKYLAVASALVVVGVVASALGKTLVPMIVIGFVIFAVYHVAKGLADGDES